ncbi:uncharacterized protein LOC128553066 [Mercenaria mercenaria]|uniref:uncharacterized protein LOC128553066 n=1 Tax=Mercenaria mercenaria TaxID=6596 RepID=UPI00234E8053|nr:uncharacterized protein LOC128553066 [Mercenaria mercenaria]
MVCYCARNKRKNKQKDKTPNGNIEEPNSSQDIELKALDESDKEPDDLKETESLLEKAQELPQENGIQQHTVEINSEEKSPKPKRKEHDSKSRKKESVKNLKHIESIENNYSANTQHFHFYNDQTQPNAANAWKEVENGTGGLAGELKKKQDDTLTPTQWNALNTQPQSVGCLIAYGDNRGTVFRVGTCYAMTAFHIFSDIVRIGDGPNEEDQFDWLLLKNDEIYVNFNESITDKPRILSKLTCIFYDRNLDVAVLKFDLISDLPRKMVLDKSGFSNPKAVNIIGFGHPSNTSKKKIDPSCSVIPAASVKIRQAHAWLQTNRIFYRQKVDDPNVVDAGYYGYDDPHKIILNCYLEHGASGAPLLAVDNKRCVVVVGILTNGIPDFYFRLSPADQRAFPTAYRFEYGTRMKDIYHAIQEANPELAKDIFGEQ